MKTDARFHAQTSRLADKQTRGDQEGRTENWQTDGPGGSGKQTSRLADRRNKGDQKSSLADRQTDGQGEIRRSDNRTATLADR